MNKRLTARDLGLPNLRDIKQTVGRDNQAMIDILVAHNKELVRQQATAGNWGWVISDKGIASKTSKGILSTDANGCKWEVR